MEPELRNLLQAALSVGDDSTVRGTRLLDDAQRLWNRVQHLLAMGLIGDATDRDALELACFALQLPPRQGKPAPSGRAPRSSLRDRTEQAAELLVSALGDKAPEALLDRTARLLAELSRRAPATDEARLLADALNLEDFGVGGLLLQAMSLARAGDGLSTVAQGAVKREQYGYWEARLKDGFHFAPLRLIAQRRLASARRVAALLKAELDEDRPS